MYIVVSSVLYRAHSEMHPKSFLSNFWGALHLTQPHRFNEVNLLAELNYRYRRLVRTNFMDFAYFCRHGTTR